MIRVNRRRFDPSASTMYRSKLSSTTASKAIAVPSGDHLTLPAFRPFGSEPSQPPIHPGRGPHRSSPRALRPITIGDAALPSGDQEGMERGWSLLPAEDRYRPIGSGRGPSPLPSPFSNAIQSPVGRPRGILVPSRIVRQPANTRACPQQRCEEVSDSAFESSETNTISRPSGGPVREAVRDVRLGKVGDLPNATRAVEVHGVDLGASVSGGVEGQFKLAGTRRLIAAEQASSQQ